MTNLQLPRACRAESRPAAATVVWRALLLGWLIAGVLLLPRPTVAAENVASDCPDCEPAKKKCPPREDDLWIISTRGAPCLSSFEAAHPTLVFLRFDYQSERWLHAAPETFFSGPDATLPTTFWSHGDRVEDADVISVGMSVYQRLVKCQKVERIRYVIWSWPSTKLYTGRPIKDAAQKSSYALEDGYRLGWVLARLPRETRVGMAGYSSGGRVLTGALHLMGGGSLLGYRVLDRRAAVGPPRYTVVILAPAIGSCAFEPGRRFEKAPSQVKRMLLLNNYCDRVLQYFPKLYGEDAIGYVGLNNPAALGEHAKRIYEFDVCGVLGPQHRWWNYVYSNTVLPKIRAYSLPSLWPVEATDDEAPRPMTVSTPAGS
ncbi:MAG: hypothetical protein DWQ35_08720 [Planctomycetota bacterium]|nr:MAG: hypothetical protein DWQ35_08720 [Planctomycetota bacterium]REK26283.1 MAG: hypothetical protein DWQ42_09310 [Planctomycetota bacterium]REK45834.1 MAG: hypothetical protein DWQ46_08025 [Planctomycetota bacterium]